MKTLGFAIESGCIRPHTLVSWYPVLYIDSQWCPVTVSLLVSLDLLGICVPPESRQANLE